MINLKFKIIKFTLIFTIILTSVKSIKLEKLNSEEYDLADVPIKHHFNFGDKLDGSELLPEIIKIYNLETGLKNKIYEKTFLPINSMEYNNCIKRIEIEVNYYSIDNVNVEPEYGPAKKNVKLRFIFSKVKSKADIIIKLYAGKRCSKKIQKTRSRTFSGRSDLRKGQ